MDDELRARFLQDRKAAFHAEPDQRARQERDEKQLVQTEKQGREKKNRQRDLVKSRMHSRWARFQQRQGGTTQMWTLLSFTGRFDPKYFKTHPKPPPAPDERTPEQKEATRQAVEARGRLRLAEKYARLRRAKQDDRIQTPKAQQLLHLLDNGHLRKEATRLTRISGHGRLRLADGSRLDLGGSTGGYVRQVLDKWAPPQLPHEDD